MTGRIMCFACGILFSASGLWAQVTGSGTTNFVPLWKSTTKLGNSALFQRQGEVGIGTKAPSAKLDVESSSPTGTGILGVSGAFGVSGVASASNGTGLMGTGPTDGVIASSSGTSGFTYGVNAWSVANPTGTGVQGIGAGIGVIGTTQSCVTGTTCPTPGTGGLFVTAAGGNPIIGAVDTNDIWTNVFRVDSTGKGFFDGGTQTGGVDFAELVAVAGSGERYEPGDLLIVDDSGAKRLKLSAESYSTLVAGIYSTKPGVLATTHKMAESAAGEVPLAIVGIVPCKVSTENGPIKPGDLLVSSSTPGYAMRGTERSRMLGAVVGKAMEALGDGKGVVQVLVTLQ